MIISYIINYIINDGDIISKYPETVICTGTKRQLLVTVPKKLASGVGVSGGTKVMWRVKDNMLVGEILI